MASISPRPLMIIHGEADETFLLQNATLLAEAAQEPKEIWIDPGVTHARLWASDPEAYVNRVAGFFDRSLLGSAAVISAAVIVEVASRDE